MDSSGQRQHRECQVIRSGIDCFHEVIVVRHFLQRHTVYTPSALPRETHVHPPSKASLRLMISVLQLDKQHHGLVIGLDLAPDIQTFITRDIVAGRARIEISSPIGGPRPPPEVGATTAGRPITPRDTATAAAKPGRALDLREMGSLAMDLKLCSKAVELLVEDWRPPLRCRPYTRRVAWSFRGKTEWKLKQRSFTGR